ncbi:MAG: response regulator transcription factor [Anaerolineales bacterium]
MKGNILVVDDESSARSSLAEILRLEGYRVITADSGEVAIQHLENDSFDVMLLDIRMPGMNGLKVLNKATTLAPDCKIILLTAHGSLESAVEALRQGAHDYLLKPASPNEILASVSQGIALRSETERKRRLLEQMESSLQQLKDVEGIEQTSPVVSSIVSIGEGVKADLDRREIWRDDTRVVLTPTEGKLMKVLLENQGRVLTHRELVFLVQGYQTTDWEAPEILRPLVSRLRRKLAAFPGGKTWINNVRGTGYVFDGVRSE